MNDKYDSQECKHYGADGNLCDKNKHKAEVGGTYWVYPCKLFHGFPCTDFATKTDKK